MKFESRLAVVGSLALILCEACSGGGGGGGTTWNNITESEPNNNLLQPNDGGAHNVGSKTRLKGHLDEYGVGVDTVDVWRISAGAACTINYTLRSDSPTADTVIDIYKVAIPNDVYIDTIDTASAGAPEIGARALNTGDAYKLAVFCNDADSEYTLELVATAPVAPLVQPEFEDTTEQQRLAQLPERDRDRVQRLMAASFESPLESDQGDCLLTALRADDDGLRVLDIERRSPEHAWRRTWVWIEGQ